MAQTPSDGLGRGGDKVSCSFCAKSQDEVRKIIAGPSIYICDECIELCLDIIAEEWNEENRSVGAAVCALCKGSTSLRLLLEIPDRGFLCFACVAAVRAAMQSETADGQ